MLVSCVFVAVSHAPLSVSGLRDMRRMALRAEESFTQT
jgi:hypothetical protein